MYTHREVHTLYLCITAHMNHIAGAGKGSPDKRSPEVEATTYVYETPSHE